MHQIWYTKYTTCTWRMANVHSILSVYTKYTLCIIGDIWSNVCTKFGTPSIRPVQGVWLTYNEVYDLHRTNGWRTKCIVRVHQVYPMYHRCPVQGVWLKYTAYSPCSPSKTYVSSECMHQIWYTKLTPLPGVWLTYNEVYDVYRTYGWRTQRIVRAHQVYPMYHRWYMV